MRTRRWTSQRGLSLIEMMIGLVLSSIIIAGIYQMFYAQQRSYLTQDQIAEMQQNLRAALSLMTRELRTAGFDPTRGSNAGLVTDFAAPDAIFSPDINYAAQTNVIAFTIDDNGNGVIERNDNEQIAYRLNGTTLERYSATRQQWEPVANNIDALNFVYLAANGTTTTVLANIRAVEMTLLVRTGKEDTHYDNVTQTYYNKRGQSICSSCGNNNYRRRLMTSTIYMRNLRV